ncbi:hypothetical protein [Cupriavidus sp. D39]|uniref:hypothetical protein n=1 Tax=Cupriavidus sp. D39 TaxID=2997877 RepID=UPI00226E08A2|nr:hypothetical protein [Cupriavidus sp. D39]MCY0853583.1 hypothetical protein [Cupriavidus sp. D39]
MATKEPPSPNLPSAPKTSFHTTLGELAAGGAVLVLLMLLALWFITALAPGLAAWPRRC